MKGINVLSLFDGMSCGQIALQMLGIKVDNYFAAEIDKHAIWVTQKNFPDTVQLGDVTKVSAKTLPQIDLLIGGSPCQGFSFAGKMLNFDDPRSKLFFEYVRILNEIRETNPKVKFLLENVKMKRESELVISRYLGINPVVINSALVSAQNRVRLYWTNIQTKKDMFGNPEPGIGQPEDKGIMLTDILEEEVDGKYFLSEKMTKNVLNPERLKKKLRAIEGDKSLCLLTGSYLKGNGTYVYSLHTPRNNESLIKKDGKTYCLGTLNMMAINNGKKLRKLTPLECERLQTVPDNYTRFCFNFDYLYVCKESNVIKKWQQNVKLKNANTILQAEKQCCVTSIIYDLSEQEALKEKLLIKTNNAIMLDATESREQILGSALNTIKDSLDTDQQNFPQETLKEKKNVNIVIESLERMEEGQEGCAIDITKTGLDIMTLYMQTRKDLKSNQEAIWEELIIRNDTGQLWKISWEECYQVQKLYTILTLIKLIIISKIYTYSKVQASIKCVISSLSASEQSCISLELLDLRMESITLNSDTQRYKMLGNGWTIDVICHILKHLTPNP